jgi:pimeloyl-ACP methyl ester carboxylesterase
VERGGVALSARLSLPEGDLPLSSVVFAHGPGPSYDALHASLVSRRLLEAGIAIILFDLSGQGRSSPDPHAGDEAFVEDLEAVFNWARRRPELDPNRIAVAASGQGALPAVRSVRRRLVRPSALVLIAPAVEPCGFVGIASPTLVIMGSEDPLAAAIKARANWSGTVTLAVLPGACHRLEEPGALHRAAELTVDWCNRHLADNIEDLSGRYWDLGEGD